MTTVNELMQQSLRLATVIGRGFTPAAEDLNEAFYACNQMLGSWSASGIIVPYRTRETFTPASSKSSYSIGSGGDFDTARPVRIHAITVTSGGSDYPLNEFDLHQYNQLATKDEQGIPDNYYYNPSHPMGTIYLDYKPATTHSITIDSLKPLSAFTSLGQTVSLPDGYEEAIKQNLAIRIGIEYGRQTPGDLAVVAQQAYDNIYAQSLSQRMSHDKVDPALRHSDRAYDILRDG